MSRNLGLGIMSGTFLVTISIKYLLDWKTVNGNDIFNHQEPCGIMLIVVPKKISRKFEHNNNSVAMGSPVTMPPSIG